MVCVIDPPMASKAVTLIAGSVPRAEAGFFVGSY